MKKKNSQLNAPKTLPLPVRHLREFQTEPGPQEHMSTLEQKRRQWLSQGVKWSRSCFLPIEMYCSYDSFASLLAAGIGSPRMSTGFLTYSWLLFCWKQTRGIYRFDPTVYESVSRSSLNKIPTEILYHMPEWCVFIETPGKEFDGHSDTGFFAAITPTERGNELHLLLLSDVEYKFVPLDLGCTTIDEALDKSEAQPDAAEPRPLLSDEKKLLKPVVSRALSLLVYLCSLEPDIRHSSGSPRQPRNPNPFGSKLTHPRKFDDWNIWKTGFRIGRVIRESIERLPHQGGTKRAHIRTGHFHKYWISPAHEQWEGPKDDPENQRQVIVRWLYPFTVNAKAGDIQPTIREVKDRADLNPMPVSI